LDSEVDCKFLWNRSTNQKEREKLFFSLFVNTIISTWMCVCVSAVLFELLASWFFHRFCLFFSIENSCCLDRTMHHHHHHHSMVRRWWLGYGLLAMNYQLLCTNKTFITAFSLSSSFPILFEKMTLPLYHQIPLFIFFTLLFPTDWLIRIRCICV